MRVAQLTAQRCFQLVDEAPPEPSSHQILVKVRAVGICGSDLHYYAEGKIGDTACVYPMVLGHEPTGEIVKTGPAVSGWSPGDRAILEPAIYCYHCEFCLSGRHNVCSNLRFLSTPGEPGFFREYVVLPARNVLPLPEGLGWETGTLFEPLAVALHSMKFAQPVPGDTAVIFGAGPIGLMTLAVLRLSGAGRVWVAEPVPHRRDMALAMGADAVIDPHEVDVAKFLKQETGNRGVDIAIDCAAKDGSMNLAIHAARNAGRVVYTGIPSEISVVLDFHEVRRKELALYTVRRSNHENDLALRLLCEESKRFAPVVTHCMAMERIEEAFAMLESYSGGAGKVVIAPAAG